MPFTAASTRSMVLDKNMDSTTKCRLANYALKRCGLKLTPQDRHPETGEVTMYTVDARRKGLSVADALHWAAMHDRYHPPRLTKDYLKLAQSGTVQAKRVSKKKPVSETPQRMTMKLESSPALDLADLIDFNTSERLSAQSSSNLPLDRFIRIQEPVVDWKEYGFESSGSDYQHCDSGNPVRRPWEASRLEAV